MAMPFGPYQNFEDCVAQNQDRENPEAFCAWLHHKITGRWPTQTKGGVKDMSERTAADSLEAQISRIHTKLEEVLAANNMDGYVIHTFEDAVVFRVFGDVAEKLYEATYALTEDDVVFGEPKEVESVYVAKRLMDENPDLTAKELQSIIADVDDSGARKEWEEDWAQCAESFKGKPGVCNPEALCSWLYYQTKGEWPVNKAAAKEREAVELTGPFVFKNDEKRIVYGAVLVPGEIDHDGEAVTAEKVEDAAHEWMELYQNVDLQHSLNNVGVPVESYLLPMEMTVKAVQDEEEMVLPKGTWILGSRLDEDTYEAAKSGGLGGYSVMGMKRTALKSLREDVAGKSASEGDIKAALKKTLLRDLGDDWVPVYVSVVDRPAVPKAKFFALKSAEEVVEESVEKEQTTLSLWDRISGAILKNHAEKEGRRFSKDTVSKLKAAADALAALVNEVEEEEARRAIESAISGKQEKGGDIEMTSEEIKALVKEVVDESSMTEEAVKSAVEEAITPFKDELQSMKSQLEAVNAAKEEDDPANASNAEGSDDPPAPDTEDLEAFKSEIMGILDGFSKKLGVDSAALKGQDGEEDSDSKKPAFKRYDRDVFGRRLQSLS